MAAKKSFYNMHIPSGDYFATILSFLHSVLFARYVINGSMSVLSLSSR